MATIFFHKSTQNMPVFSKSLRITKSSTNLSNWLIFRAEESDQWRETSRIAWIKSGLECLKFGLHQGDLEVKMIEKW